MLSIDEITRQHHESPNQTLGLLISQQLPCATSPMGVIAIFTLKGRGLLTDDNGPMDSFNRIEASYIYNTPYKYDEFTTTNTTIG